MQISSIHIQVCKWSQLPTECANASGCSANSTFHTATEDTVSFGYTVWCNRSNHVPMLEWETGLALISWAAQLFTHGCWFTFSLCTGSWVCIVGAGLRESEWHGNLGWKRLQNHRDLADLTVGEWGAPRSWEHLGAEAGRLAAQHKTSIVISMMVQRSPGKCHHLADHALG